MRATPSRFLAALVPLALAVSACSTGGARLAAGERTVYKGAPGPKGWTPSASGHVSAREGTPAFRGGDAMHAALEWRPGRLAGQESIRVVVRGEHGSPAFFVLT